MVTQVAIKNEETVAQQPTFVTKVVKALRSTSDMEFIEVLIALIKERKKSIINQVKTYYLVELSNSRNRIHMKSNSGREYEIKIKRLNKKFEDEMNRIDDIFNSFVIVNPKVINMGSAQRGNFRVCVYGQSDAFKNAVWIHTHMVEELLLDIPKNLPVQQDAKEYIKLVNDFYQMVCSLR